MCTAIKIDYEHGCIMGRTMDYETPLNYNAIYLPRNYNYSYDLMGEPLYSKYKVLGMGFENRNPLKDGVNEYGLVGITNDFVGFNLYDNKINIEKTNISSLYYLTYALTNYKSVEELVEDLGNIHLSSKDNNGQNIISPDFHFMFTDSTNRCIVIEPVKKKLIYYENPYNVLTNSPGLETHVKRLNSILNLNDLDEFNSAKDLPGGYDPVSRFIKAFYMTGKNVKANNYKEGLSHCYNILSAMTMPQGFIKNNRYKNTTHTIYTCAYDTKNRLLTVKSHTNPTVYHLSFDDIENKEERQSFFINCNFTTIGLK